MFSFKSRLLILCTCSVSARRNPSEADIPPIVVITRNFSTNRVHRKPSLKACKMINITAANSLGAEGPVLEREPAFARNTDLPPPSPLGYSWREPTENDQPSRLKAPYLLDSERSIPGG
ncbi:hypothetical protein AVEN_205549-1 [Araneus ventricosus]|uniref:Uncharacterized protein n=1 Tax=Araneus ventricosus TaxID=182803 RepID=A0A4Y2JMF5_ARAVE|nr:hypothetical protein AVEN_205549-1 [Araneus ventricosus]